MVNRSLLYFFFLFAGLIFLGWYFAYITAYFVISLILATLLRPLTNRITQLYLYDLHVPRFVAIIISFIVLLAVIFTFVLLFIPLIREQIEIITTLNYEAWFHSATIPLQNLEKFLIENNLVDEKQGFIVESLRENIFSLISSIDIQAIINQLLSLTGNFFIGTLAVIFITFILLYDQGLVRRQFLKLIPNQYFEVSIAAIYKIDKLLSNYLLGLLFQIFSIFTLASIGLSIFNVKYAITIAFFAAVANLIPYAGPILGAVFGIIVGLSTSGFLSETNEVIFFIIKIVSVFASVQMIDNLLLQPFIFSRSVKAHPLEVFLAIFAGATIANVVGMILAIPAYTVIRVITRELLTGYKQYYIFQKK